MCADFDSQGTMFLNGGSNSHTGAPGISLAFVVKINSTFEQDWVVEIRSDVQTS